MCRHFQTTASDAFLLVVVVSSKTPPRGGHVPVAPHTLSAFSVRIGAFWFPPPQHPQRPTPQARVWLAHPTTSSASYPGRDWFASCTPVVGPGGTPPARGRGYSAHRGIVVPWFIKSGLYMSMTSSKIHFFYQANLTMFVQRSFIQLFNVLAYMVNVNHLDDVFRCFF
jgi:hypothetical protein